MEYLRIVYNILKSRSLCIIYRFHIAFNANIDKTKERDRERQRERDREKERERVPNHFKF